MVKRTRWRPFAFIAFALVIVVIGAVVTGKMKERKEFIGRLDQATGYRCRFTLAPNWQRVNLAQDTQWISQENFSPSPPNPIRAWITTHLFHQAVSSHDSLMITVISPKRSRFPFVQSQAGYPELPPYSPRTVLAHRHTRIDGFPATVIRTDAQTFLLVCLPDNTAWYIVTDSGTLSNSAQADREMQSVIASFHIEKVAAPTGGK